MKDTILKFLGDYFGRTLAGAALRIIIAFIVFASGGWSDPGQAISIALDKQKALAQAAVLINESTSKEVIDAVKEKDADANVLQVTKIDGETTLAIPTAPADPPAQ